MPNLGCAHTKGDFGGNQNPPQNEEREEDRSSERIFAERTGDMSGEGHRGIEGEEIDNEEGSMTKYEIIINKNNDIGDDTKPPRCDEGKDEREREGFFNERMGDEIGDDHMEIEGEIGQDRRDWTKFGVFYVEMKGIGKVRKSRRVDGKGTLGPRGDG